MNRSMDELPEPIIQHILTFLTAKEATQTTILSSSWLSAWLTQPNLAFEIQDDLFGRKKDLTQKLELARKTIQRYEESNQRIQSLTLHADRVRYDDTLCKRLIAKSLKLGATHLNLILGYEYKIPHDIVLGSQKLVGLSVERGKIEIGSRGRKVIRCSGLESLSLRSTDISLFSLSNIISSCPSIRKLSLSSIRGVDEEGVIRSVGLGLINLHSLTRLELVCVDFDSLFLGDMSSRFPSLKDLTLHTRSTTISQDNVIWISSRSLERLNFARSNGYGPCEKRVSYKFDVPSIRRFTYEGSDSPLLTIKTTSRGWESRVFIRREKNIGSVWFRRLNCFLTKLRRSKISHLSLKFRGRWPCFDYEPGEIQGLRSKRPRVENLTVDMRGLPNLNCFALFDGLFQVCRPKLITQILHRPGQWGRARRKIDNNYFLCKAFLARHGGTSESHHWDIGLRDLDEVNVEIFDQEMALWRHVTLNSLLDDASTSWATDEWKRKIRFQLKWKR